MGGSDRPSGRAGGTAGEGVFLPNRRLQQPQLPQARVLALADHKVIMHAPPSGLAAGSGYRLHKKLASFQSHWSQRAMISF